MKSIKFIKSISVLAVVALLVAAALFMRSRTNDDPSSSLQAETLVRAPVPAFVELGSDKCTSCRAMIPVLEELRSTHGCNLDVRFVDVWDDPTEGERFGVTTIPTQVLLDPDGREITRHTGFWSADAIRVAFASAGYTLSAQADGCES